MGAGAGRAGQVGAGGGYGAPLVLGKSAVGEVVEREACQRAEPVPVERVERDADDAAAGDEARAGEVAQARQQLALGKVAGGPDEHHHLRLLRPDAR